MTISNKYYFSIEDLKGLPGASGTQLALNDEWMIVAASQRLEVWKDYKRIAGFDATQPINGYPRIIGNCVYWGNYILNIRANELNEIKGIEPQLSNDTFAAYLPSPKGRYKPAFYAWSPGGDQFIVTVNWRGSTKSPSSKTLLFGSDGQVKSILWEGNDIAPRAACIADDWMILGTREPRVYKRDGQLDKLLPAGIPAIRLEATSDEKVLMELQSGQINLWNTTSWEKLESHPGLWMDASISPDGTSLLATGFGGSLLFLDRKIPGSTFQAIPVEDRVQDVALGQGRFVASFMSGDPVRTGTLAIQHTIENI